MSDRNASLLMGLSKSDPIVEVGPSFNPIAAKRDGWNTTIVDHANAAELAAKYADATSVDTTQIEEVDVIWQGGPIHEAFPAERTGSYRALIASHVIEHMPDLIGFLDSAAKLLHPEHGVLVLAIPDKRWCFDVLKPVSTTGEVLTAHRAHLSRHSPATRFDQIAYTALNAGVGGWNSATPREIRLAHTLAQAKDFFDAYSEDPAAPYADCHCWHFTPAAFELTILELGAMGVSDWRVDWIAPQPAIEFLARLVRGREALDDDALERRRLELLMRAVADLKEQTDWFFGSQAAPTAPPATASAAADDDARVAALESDLAQLREELRPVRSALAWLMPVRSRIARLRGRV